MNHTNINQAVTAICLLCLLVATPLSAQTMTTSESPAATLELATTSQASSSAMVVRTKLLERARGRLINVSANITAYQETIIARLEQISARLESRIAMEQATSSITVSAQAEHAAASAALTKAKTTLRSITIQVSTTTITFADLNTAWQSARTLYTATNASVEVAKRALLRSHNPLAESEAQKNPLGISSTAATATNATN